MEGIARDRKRVRRTWRSRGSPDELKGRPISPDGCARALSAASAFTRPSRVAFTEGRAIRLAARRVTQTTRGIHPAHFEMTMRGALTPPDLDVCPCTLPGRRTRSPSEPTCRCRTSCITQDRVSRFSVRSKMHTREKEGGADLARFSAFSNLRSIPPYSAPEDLYTVATGAVACASARREVIRLPIETHDQLRSWPG